MHHWCAKQTRYLNIAKNLPRLEYDVALLCSFSISDHVARLKIDWLPTTNQETPFPILPVDCRSQTLCLYLSIERLVRHLRSSSLFVLSSASRYLASRQTRILRHFLCLSFSILSPRDKVDASKWRERRFLCLLALCKVLLQPLLEKRWF